MVNELNHANFVLDASTDFNPLFTGPFVDAFSKVHVKAADKSLLQLRVEQDLIKFVVVSSSRKDEQYFK